MSSLEAVWKELRAGYDSTAVPAGGYSMQLIESAPSVRVFAAWGGSAGGPGLLVDIPLKFRKAIRSQLSSRAFSVQVAEFPGLPADRVGVMTNLSDSAYQDLFQLLCDDLRTAVCSAPTEPAAVAALQRVVERWRHFVERRSAPLSSERVRGLIGEAVILMRLMAHTGALNALTQWTGPHDALRDFELDDASLEVKTYQTQTGSSVRISDPEQLESTSGRPVYLAVVEMAGNMSSGRTLPEILAVLSESVATYPGGSELLEEKLAQYGYLSAHAALYTEAYVIGNTRLYAVEQGFPRLFPSIIPAGVDNVEFSVRLAAIALFEIDAVGIIGGATALEAPGA
jgi:hypothetical protein